MTDPLLSVTDLRTYFETDAGVVRAVDGMSFDVRPGEVVGLVGESGAGKTVAARSILRLVDDPGRIVGGEIRFRDRTLVGFEEPTTADGTASPDATTSDTSTPDAAIPDPEPRSAMLPETAMREEIRGSEIAMIFQNPSETLNPVRPVGEQLREVIVANRDLRGADARDEALGLLREVGVPDAESRVEAYPHQLSGGMCQRVLIAMALACEPGLIVADEPTTALDPTVEGQIIDLVGDLQARYETSVLWITHDMGVVAELCDRVNVAYAGEIVERASADALFHDTRHPYTEALLAATPRPHDPRKRLDPIDGTMPEPIDPPRGCRFHPRCPDAREVCPGVRPDCRPVDDGHGDEQRDGQDERRDGRDEQRDGPEDGRGDGRDGERAAEAGDDTHCVACVKSDAFPEVDYDESPPLGALASERPGESDRDGPGGQRDE